MMYLLNTKHIKTSAIPKERTVEVRRHKARAHVSKTPQNLKPATTAIKENKRKSTFTFIYLRYSADGLTKKQLKTASANEITKTISCLIQEKILVAKSSFQ